MSKLIYWTEKDVRVILDEDSIAEGYLKSLLSGSPEKCNQQTWMFVGRSAWRQPFLKHIVNIRTSLPLREKNLYRLSTEIDEVLGWVQEHTIHRVQLDCLTPLSNYATGYFRASFSDAQEAMQFKLIYS